MATKKTDKKTDTKTKAAAKPAAKTASTRSTKSTKAPASKAKVEPKKEKGAKVDVAGRHPRARLVAKHGSKEALAKTLAASLARPDEDQGTLAETLKTASNKQLLRLAKVTETVKSKWGSREKLIAAIGESQKKGKDKDFLTKLGTYSLPQLVDIANRA